MRISTPTELGRLADKMDDRYRAPVLVAGYGGLRIGELSSLHVGDINRKRKQVRVERTASWVTGHLHINQPKTAGRRSVALPPFVWDALVDHLTRDAGPEIVFPAPGGGYLQPNLFRRRQFAPAVTAAKLDPLRHTAVSLRVASGADVKRVAARAGHASTSFTLDRYGHLYPDAEDDLMGALDALGRVAAEPDNVVPSRSTRA